MVESKGGNVTYWERLASETPTEQLRSDVEQWAMPDTVMSAIQNVWKKELEAREAMQKAKEEEIAQMVLRVELQNDRTGLVQKPKSPLGKLKKLKKLKEAPAGTLERSGL